MSLRTQEQAIFLIQVELASYQKKRQDAGKTLENILAILDGTTLHEGSPPTEIGRHTIRITPAPSVKPGRS